MPRKSEMQPIPAEITGMMIGGAVPLEAVGFVLAALYRAGATHMEHAPVFNHQLPGAQVMPGLSHDDALQLPPPKRASMSEMLLEVLKNGPAGRGEFKAALVAAGFKPNSLATALSHAIASGMIKKVGPNQYALAAAAKHAKPSAKKVVAKPSKTRPPLTGVVAAAVKRGRGKPVHIDAIRAALVAAGFSRATYSYALRSAITAGLVKASAEKKQHYQMADGVKTKLNGKASKAVKRTEMSHRDFIEGLLKNAHPGVVTSATMRAKSGAKGYRIASTSVALSFLKQHGVIEATDQPSTYRYIPENKRANTEGASKS